MKLTKRILLTLPIIIVTFLYLRLNLSDNGCWGLIEFFYQILLFILFIPAFIMALNATLYKGKNTKKWPEPITFIITLLTVLMLITGITLGESFKGGKWLYAESNSETLPTQNMTLRNNGTFRIDLNYADFGCYFSGKYKKEGDTIIFDKNIIKQTDSFLTTNYLLNDTMLIPLDKWSTKTVEFIIKEIK